jgi:cytidylate kinase
LTAVTKSHDSAEKVKHRVIAIDGPAAAGKSTTARLLAARLGYQYLDTGAMYRAVTALALRNGIAPGNGAALTRLAEKVTIVFETHDDINRVFVDGEEMTDNIRTPEVTLHVSEVSAHAGVRAAMVALQKAMGRNGSVVAEGRDTTTVVFPDADLKVYLDAAVEERAKRRVIDLERLGRPASRAEIEADIRRRDSYDSGRQHSPLTRATDAHIIDTTDLTIDEQVDRIIDLLKTTAS